MPDVPESLRHALASGRVIPFVGAGVSMAVRRLDAPDRALFPSWKQLLLCAAERLEQNDKKPDADIVRGFVDRGTPDYLASARQARVGLGADWFAFLSGQLDPPNNLVDPGSLELARAVWSLSHNVVITTNYDRVLHWTCPNLKELSYWDIEAPAEQNRLLRGDWPGPTVWHLHGSIRNATQIILTPDGYQALYDDQQAGERMCQAALATLRMLFASRTFLFIGFSLEDAGVAAQLEWIARTFRGAAGPHFVLAALSERDGIERRLQSTQGVELVTFSEYGSPMVNRVRELAAIAHPDREQVKTESAEVPSQTAVRAASAPEPVTGGELLARSLLGLAPQDALPPRVIEALFEAFQETANRSSAEHNLEVLVLSRRLHTSCDPAVAARLEALLRRSDLLPHVMAEGRHMLGWAENQNGRFGPALAQFDAAMTAAETAGAHGLYSRILNSAGYAHRARHSYQEAAQHFTRSFDIKQKVGDVIGLEMTRQALAWLAAMRGRFSDAWRLFGEGIDASIAGLAARPSDMSLEALHDLVSSLAYHVIGRCTLGLLMGQPPSSFEACRNQCEPWLEPIVVMATPKSHSLYREANAMLHLGVRTPLEDDPAAEGILRFWSLVGRSIDDPEANALVLSQFVRKAIDSGQADVHMKLLAGVAFANSASESVTLAALNADVISRLREFGYDGIPDKPSQWPAPAVSIPIDSSTWCDWGPLRHKHALLHTPGAFVGPAATEHYLQLLAWVSMILLAAEGAVDRHGIYALIDTTYPEGPSVRLNLGQSFGICHRVAQRCDPVSPFGERLQKFWAEEAFWPQSPYVSRSDLSEERNRYSHAEDQTHQGNRVIVERHVRLINLLVEPLQREALPRILRSQRSIASGDACPALLVNGKGDAYDCGALFLSDSRDDSAYYLPHLLSRTSLRGQPGHKSEFIRYESSPRARRSRVNVRWLD